MTSEHQHESLHKKLDNICDNQKEMRKDIKKLNKQMPGEAQLQTQAQCEQVSSGLEDRISETESRSRYRDAAVGTVAGASVMWHIWRVFENGGHRAAGMVRELIRAWI